MGWGWASGILDGLNAGARGIHDNYDPAGHWLNSGWHAIGGNKIPDQPGLHSIASGYEKKPVNYTAALLAAMYGGAAAAGGAGGSSGATGSLYGSGAGIGGAGSGAGIGAGEGGATGTLYGSGSGISGAGGVLSLFGTGSAGDFGAGMSGGAFAGGDGTISAAGGSSGSWMNPQRAQQMSKLLKGMGQQGGSSPQTQHSNEDFSQPAFMQTQSNGQAQSYSPAAPKQNPFDNPYTNPYTNAMNPYANRGLMGGGYYGG